jgi:hypothetical protein
MAAPAFGATDVLSLGADWEPQGYDEATAQARATAAGNEGDIIAESAYNSVKSGTARYIYIGAETTYGAALTGADAHPGKYLSTAAVVVTGVEVDYSPVASGQREVCTFTYRAGPSADCLVYTVALATLATKPTAVPDLVTNSDSANSECTSARYSIQAQFGESLDKDGAFLAGTTYGGEETLTLEYVGTPTLVTTGWIATSDGDAKSNTGYNTTPVTLVRKIAHT